MPVDKSQIKEFEKAVVDGIELTADWNRMFDQRVVFDYDPNGAMDKVTDIPGGESMGWCYQCGQCIPVCPVDIAGGDYGPLKIFRKLQQGIELLPDPDLWKCTTCMNCLRVCPKAVNMIEIMPATREAAVLDAKVPKELQDVFESTFEYGNPLGESPRKRADWVTETGSTVSTMKDLARPVDMLWFVGSYPSYHARGKDASRALAKVLNLLGADFGILGTEEKDDCDSFRLAGETGLFEEFAEYNIKTFKKYKVKKILLTDPHALNAFRKEYPKLGGDFEVIHYSTFLAPLMDKLDFKKKLNYKVTFHDPCYLGRHNGEFDAPRNVLKAIPGIDLIEMGRCRENSYCCGGGGGGMWLDGFMSDHVNERLSEKRVREAVETGADVLAVCCPYEVSRFEDAVKSTGNEGKLIVRDIVELMEEALG
ncbi:MAG: 4Fe-4S dicluster domain-containing protein [Saprospirales bacterium]|nr:4Fe-4S dicluster domain-containing protein [Saprospirales bacterium]MBK8490931.1 4Fe-4S dicluster domain-containing protein [Saprospirales bacterium]